MRHSLRFRHLIPAVCLVILGLRTPCFADSTVVFNEIMYHPGKG